MLVSSAQQHELAEVYILRLSWTTLPHPPLPYPTNQIHQDVDGPEVCHPEQGKSEDKKNCHILTHICGI